MEQPQFPIATDARAVLVRTRPWMYFLGIVSVIVVALCLILVLAGAAGLGADRVRGTLLILAGLIGAVVGTVVAALQLRYASALSAVERADDNTLQQALEQACIRQRSLWIAVAVIAMLGALGALVRAIAAMSHIGG